MKRKCFSDVNDWLGLGDSGFPVLFDVPQVHLFSEPGFQGSALVLENSVASLRDGFSVGSCKVLAGRYMLNIKRQDVGVVM